MLASCWWLFCLQAFATRLNLLRDNSKSIDITLTSTTCAFFMTIICDVCLLIFGSRTKQELPDFPINTRHVALKRRWPHWTSIVLAPQLCPCWVPDYAALFRIGARISGCQLGQPYAVPAQHVKWGPRSAPIHTPDNPMRVLAGELARVRAKRERGPHPGTVWTCLSGGSEFN